jgi:geranylgeranyl reductase family protein
MRSLDVVVVGAGPAGISTALFLTHAAPALTERVLVLERERFPRDKYCAGGVGARADKLLGSIGVCVDVPSVWIDGIAFRAMGRTTTVREPRIGRVVRRVEFDHELALQARARGIAIAEDTRVTALERRPEGWQVHTNRGSFATRVVVGADGVQSVVRRALGFGSTRYRAQAIEVDTEPVRGDLERDLLVFDATHRQLPGYYWDFPTLVDGREMVVRGVYVLRPADAPAAVEIQAVLARELEARGIDMSALRRKRYAELAFDPHAPVSRPGVLLVGEAAGIDPVTGEGIAQAIQYGATAGRYLADKIRDRDFAFEDWQRAIRWSSIGRDLIVRNLGVSLIYGAPRANVEHFLHEVPDFVRIGAQHFAGKRWSRPALARASWRALLHTAGFFLGRTPGHPAPAGG